MANGYQPGQPQRQKGQARSSVVPIPAPWGGWNARDALTSMRPEHAIQLDNFIPDAGGVRLRLGYDLQSAGLGTRVDTVMGYNPPAAGTGKLFAAAGTTIWDCTGATAASAVTGLTNAKFQHVMHGTPAGSYLVACNGADAVQLYNGSAWSAAAITGVDPTTFINVTSHQSRLWFTQVNTLDAWYLPTASIGGAANRLMIGPYCRKGGHLLAIASWTRDGGAGQDDQAVFITSNGEAVLYSGSDPSSTTLWQKVGTFNIPEPVGRRCFVQIGADLGLITSQGVVPLSSILPLSPTGAAKTAATDQISGAFGQAYRGGKGYFGWQAIEAPKDRLLIINVPVAGETGTDVRQFVMNTMSGAWCQFVGIPANCWGMLGDAVFFGDMVGNVFEYGQATSDAGAAISAISWSAFTDLGQPRIKQVVEARAMVQGEDGYVPGLDIRVDYELGIQDIPPVSIPATGGGTFWPNETDDPEDPGYWGPFEVYPITPTPPITPVTVTEAMVGEWGTGLANSAVWQTVSGLGTVISVGIEVESAERLQYNNIDLLVEMGGVM